MRYFKKFTGLCMVLLLLGEICLPGRAFSITISEEEELGREFMDTVNRRFRLVPDPTVEAYVNAVGQRILATMPPQPFKYHFYVIRNHVYNAFAGPAGHIFIHSGLIEAMDSEDELAGILAHEITHVTSRHISQKIERSSKLTMGALAGMVAGIFLGAAGAGSAASAVGVSSMAATQAASLSYSRQDEMQADELGVEYLTRAGYSGKGLLSILRKIREKQWYGTEQVPTYLMTHPALEDRIIYLDGWMESHPGSSAPAKDHNAAFRTIHTRLVAAYGDRETALKQMTNAFKKTPDDPAIQHGYGVALARNDDPKQGIGYIRKALRSRPFDPVILKDLGETCFMAGQYDEALQALSSSLIMDAADYETLYLLGRTRIELGKYPEAVENLKAVLEKKPKYGQAFYYLGEAFGKNGDAAESHYYLGLYYRQKGNMKNAVFHLKQAVKQSQDPARKEEIEKILREPRKGPGKPGKDSGSPEEPAPPSLKDQDFLLDGYQHLNYKRWLYNSTD